MDIQPEHNVLYFLKKEKFRVNNLKKREYKTQRQLFLLCCIMRSNKNKKKTYLFEIILTSKYNSLWKWGLEIATRGVLCRKVFLKVWQNSKENTCARVSFLIFYRKPPGDCFWWFDTSKNITNSRGLTICVNIGFLYETTLPIIWTCVQWIKCRRINTFGWI